jgi:cysteine desulfurase/selenocysteine lyase
LSQRSTELFESVRARVQRVLNAAEVEEIIFTKGCTEGINLVAQSYARPRLKPGDEILVSHMEHHSNLVPWQLVAEQTGATVRAIPIDDRGQLIFEEFEKLLSDRTKILAIVHVSNSIGTINPVKEMIKRAKSFGAICLVDGAQAGPHLAIDVQDLDADFYTLSCHKMYAPTGVGILYGKRELLESMPPYQGGGNMIRSVSIERTTYAEIPDKFEPGTPNVIGFIGYGASLDYLACLTSGNTKPDWTRSDWVRSMDAIAAHEHEVLDYGTKHLSEVPGVSIYGTADSKAAILSFVVAGAHAHDVGHILDSVGVAVRVGHHCCQPLMTRFGIAATARASFGLYNTMSEVDQLVDGMKKVKEVFA